MRDERRLAADHGRLLELLIIETICAIYIPERG